MIKNKDRGEFAVVTPNLNMGRFLGKTIASVLRNLRPGDQYVIVDGGSTDESLRVIRDYERRLSGWISEPDRGYADAIAKGFEWTRSRYMCWVNSGDLLLAGALDLARGILDANDDIDFIFGNDVYIDETDAIIHFSDGRVRSLRDAMLYGGWTPLQDACFWRRDLYDRIGGIAKELKYAADFDLFLRMAVNGRTRHVGATFSAFRQHPSQKSISGRNDYRRERERCRRRELDRLADSPPRTRWREAYHWFGVRCKAHFRSKVSPGDAFRGAPVESLTCEDHAESF